MVIRGVIFMPIFTKRDDISGHIRTLIHFAHHQGEAPFCF